MHETLRCVISSIEGTSVKRLFVCDIMKELSQELLKAYPQNTNKIQRECIEDLT